MEGSILCSLFLERSSVFFKGFSYDICLTVPKILKHPFLMTIQFPTVRVRLNKGKGVAKQSSKNEGEKGNN